SRGHIKANFELVAVPIDDLGSVTACHGVCYGRQAVKASIVKFCRHPIKTSPCCITQHYQHLSHTGDQPRVRLSPTTHQSSRHQSASPLTCNLKVSSSTVPCPARIVRTIHIGPRQESVLKRMALPAAQPLPQPPAGMVKYGVPVAGLIGAQSAPVEPLAMMPSCCSTTWNDVLP